MKRAKKTFTLYLALICIIVFGASSVYAAVPKEFSFKVGGTTWGNIKCAKESRTPNWVVNLKKRSNQPIVRIQSWMTRNGVEYGYMLVNEGQRLSKPHTRKAPAGYEYGLWCLREYNWDKNITVSGSWSPDDKNML